MAKIKVARFCMPHNEDKARERQEALLREQCRKRGLDFDAGTVTHTREDNPTTRTQGRILSSVWEGPEA